MTVVNLVTTVLNVGSPLSEGDDRMRLSRGFFTEKGSPFRRPGSRHNDTPPVPGTLNRLGLSPDFRTFRIDRDATKFITKGRERRIDQRQIIGQALALAQSVA